MDPARRLNTVEQERKEVVDRLVQVAVVILLAILFYEVLIEAFKGPAGRVRFRTMNVMGDFSEYAPWYAFHGPRVLSRTGELVAGTLPAAERFLGLSDTCKSFPSGHTYAAAVSYAALCLQDLFPDMKHSSRVACLLLPTLLTVIVGLGRVMAGAHFLTDVVIGGLAAYLIVTVARWGIRKLWILSRQEEDLSDVFGDDDVSLELNVESIGKSVDELRKETAEYYDEDLDDVDADLVNRYLGQNMAYKDIIMSACARYCYADDAYPVAERAEKIIDDACNMLE